jgi:hypothetical protein
VSGDCRIAVGLRQSSENNDGEPNSKPGNDSLVKVQDYLRIWRKVRIQADWCEQIQLATNLGGDAT